MSERRMSVPRAFEQALAALKHGDHDQSTHGNGISGPAGEMASARASELASASEGRVMDEAMNEVEGDDPEIRAHAQEIVADEDRLREIVDAEAQAAGGEGIDGSAMEIAEEALWQQAEESGGEEPTVQQIDKLAGEVRTALTGMVQNELKDRLDG